MHEIYFYEDKSGKSPILEYIQMFDAKPDKDSRIKVNKIYDYIDFLHKKGKGAGGPYIKHLDGEIWELRPINDRILFASWEGDGFILLHRFVKKTQKTPQREIDKAKRNLAEMRERSEML